MRIGIIGAGQIGGTLAVLFIDAGHEVALSNSRGPETLAGLVDELGGRAQASTVAKTARFGDVIVVAVPFGRYCELPTEGVAGKVVIDANYDPQRDGHFEELDSGRATSSELLQAHLPGARARGQGLQRDPVDAPARQRAVPLGTQTGSASRSPATTSRRNESSRS
jgi:8-hydroxy-5-deazaflavin:NADPH oxidoreductase